MTNRVKVRITIAKLLELAYSKDEGLTTKIVLSKGNFKLKVNTNGDATLSSSAGMLTFRGGPALTGLGAKIKNISVSFSQGEDKKTNYMAMFSFSGAANISISGTFDIEKLITSCSGLLCQAARLLQRRNKQLKAYDMELQRIMGY
ncbi:hypothetical protein MNBD_GAMMA23-1049 [hydrothermal vent metagenome]|uniref:Uncharacterized protein n=1 Tax=hydrothermal vent metagenome TaxID=652676 RepID=A0A3B0ZDQ5_9ZZZZ